MKGLVYIPQEKELIKWYEKLQFASCSEADIALVSQYVRLDPRLGEILVKYIFKNWKHISPALLNEANQKHPWPQVLGVVLEWVTLKLNGSNTLFEAWKKCVMHAVLPAPFQLFFINLRSVGGELMQKDAQESLLPYSKWGFLCADPLVEGEGQVTLLDAKIRKMKLKAYLKKRGMINVKIYRELLENKVSARQAQRDLNLHPHLKSKGKTQGCVWVKV